MTGHIYGLLDPLQHVVVSRDFMRLVVELYEKNPNFTVTYAGVNRVKDVGPLAITSVATASITHGDPMEVLIKYVRAKHMRLADLFQRLDLDKSNTVSRSEFIHGLQVDTIELCICLRACLSLL